MTVVSVVPGGHCRYYTVPAGVLSTVPYLTVQRRVGLDDVTVRRPLGPTALWLFNLIGGRP